MASWWVLEDEFGTPDIASLVLTNNTSIRQAADLTFRFLDDDGATLATTRCQDMISTRPGKSWPLHRCDSGDWLPRDYDTITVTSTE